jgi:glycosyltransferase involved in cell wall biosynthesis
MEQLDLPKASLIIACYKQYDFLEKVLYSLLNQSFQDFEIVLADDGSGPEMGSLVDRFKGQFKHPIQHVWHEDIGFRKTIIVNQAVVKSKSNYLVFIDGDCVLHHKFIERHYKRKENGVVLSGRRIMLSQDLTEGLAIEAIQNRSIEKRTFWWNHSEPKERKRGFYLPFCYSLLNAISKDYWAFGSNFSLHKADLLAINGYDEGIVGRGLEDINLSQRFKLKGYKIKRLTYEALQYHLFHKSGPVPHSEAETEQIINPKDAYAAKGII